MRNTHHCANAGKTLFAENSKAGGIRCAFSYDKWRMTSIKIHCAIGTPTQISNFIISPFQSMYFVLVKQKPQMDLCAQLASRFPLPNDCTRWRCNFKGLSLDGGGGGGRNSLKFSPRTLWAKSSSLDNTFKAVLLFKRISYFFHS